MAALFLYDQKVSSTYGIGQLPMTDRKMGLAFLHMIMDDLRQRSGANFGKVVAEEGRAKKGSCFYIEFWDVSPQFRLKINVCGDVLRYQVQDLDDGDWLNLGRSFQHLYTANGFDPLVAAIEAIKASPIVEASHYRNWSW